MVLKKAKVQIEVVREMPWSTVYRIPSSQGNLYLKLAANTLCGDGEACDRYRGFVADALQLFLNEEY
jgi:hypothetical protein